MKRHDVKSRCPINFALEVFGDPWALLIVRDMLALGKKRFGEFLESEERIGPSVLADRLMYLEKKGIIVKQGDLSDKRKTVYSLTAKGLDAIPIVYDLALWGSHTSLNPKAPESWFASMAYDRALVLKLWREAVESGSAFFTGPASVVTRLGL